jgi:hypothetical protein
MSTNRYEIVTMPHSIGTVRSHVNVFMTQLLGFGQLQDQRWKGR